MEAYKITPGKGNNSCIEETIDAVKAWIDGMDIGSTLIITKIKIDDKKFAALDEYEGQ